MALNLTELIQSLFSQLESEGCAMYHLNPGSITSNSTDILFSETHSNLKLTTTRNFQQLAQLSFPSVYFANCTNLTRSHEYYTQFEAILRKELIEKSKDQFTTSVTLLNFVICTIVVSSWLLLVIECFASNTKPYYLKLATLLLSVSSTVTLAKISNLMKIQYNGCYQDSHEVLDRILTSNAFEISFYVSELLVYVNWAFVCRKIINWGFGGGTHLLSSGGGGVGVGQSSIDEGGSGQLHSNYGGGLGYGFNRGVLANNSEYKHPVDYHLGGGSGHGSTFWTLKSIDLGNRFFMFLSAVFIGLQYFMITEDDRDSDDYSLGYWINVCLLVFTCIRYFYVLCLFTIFLIFKISYMVKFKTMSLLLVTFGCLFLSVGLNITNIIVISKEVKWLVPVYLFFEVLAINLIFEFLSDLKHLDEKKEHTGIVGREITFDDSNGGINKGNTINGGGKNQVIGNKVGSQYYMSYRDDDDDEDDDDDDDPDDPDGYEMSYVDEDDVDDEEYQTLLREWDETAAHHPPPLNADNNDNDNIGRADIENQCSGGVYYSNITPSNVVVGSSNDNRAGHEGLNEYNNDDDTELPPFEPHPGFNPGDYWDDKTRL